MTLIYHITTRDDALAARQSGEYRADSLSEAGFIHLSQRHQVLDVANALFAWQKGLVLLVVEPSRLKAELKYEPPVHPSTSATVPSAENLFPHLYGSLNFDAVVDVVDFPPGADGRFVLPPTLS